MPAASEPTDPLPGGRCRRTAPTRLASLLALLLATAVLSGCTDEESIKPPRPPANAAAAHAEAAARTLTALERAVTRRDPHAAAGLAAASSPRLTENVVANAGALGVRNLRLRYVDENVTTLGARQQRRFGEDAWVGAVDVRYRLPMDPGPTRMEVAFVFTPKGGRALIGAIGGHGDRSPLWMRGAATVLRSGRVTVVDANGDAGRYRSLGRQALRDVGRVLHDWKGNLVIEVPRSQSELDSLLHADARTYANIAAVTTTVDGSLASNSPVHVFINPQVFDGLRREGAQVVISHETTHVATGATFTDMPTWLLEGFADYVALAHAGVPVQVAAAQILARVREHGPPRRLPTTGDLSPTANGLGATYEEAWLACRYLAQQYGEDALVRFYRSVDRGQPLERAFVDLGTTRKAFVTGWSSWVAGLARQHG